MSDIICVSNRSLCTGDFDTQIKKLAKAHPVAIILREKDLSELDYEQLARRALAICNSYQVPLIIHSFWQLAKKLGCSFVHLPLALLEKMPEEEKKAFQALGTSCHSVEDVRLAEKLKATYIIAGHIFETDCKKGLAGRGLPFLKEVCETATVPVYAIGGIDRSNIQAIRACGAAGACVMSGAMKCEDADAFLGGFHEIS